MHGMVESMKNEKEIKMRIKGHQNFIKDFEIEPEHYEALILELKWVLK